VSSRTLASHLFSRTATITIAIVVAALLAANVYTFHSDSKLQSFSLGEVRLASWTLTQLGNEAHVFDRELALAGTSEEDLSELSLRYDIVWSRLDYLLKSAESIVTRSVADNEARLVTIFRQLMSLEAQLIAYIETQDPAQLAALRSGWEEAFQDIRNLQIENFVGGDSGRLVDQMDASRDRLMALRQLTLVILGMIILHLVAAIVYVWRISRVDQLTNLPNMNHLRSLRTIDPASTVIACEIRSFREIQQEVGSEGADTLIVIFSRRLKKMLSLGDELIQTGQCDFLIITSPDYQGSEVSRLLGLVRATSFEWRHNDSIFLIRPTFGVVEAENEISGISWRDRIQNALRALRDARARNEDYSIYCKDIHARLTADKRILKGLIDLFAGKESTLAMHIVVQPVVTVSAEQEIVGAEVLLRGIDSQLGPVAPPRLVGICERNGLGWELGCWLFDEVSRECGPLFRSKLFDGMLTINLNPSMLDNRLYPEILNRLISPGIPGKNLIMEITEDNASVHFEAMNAIIKEVGQLGTHFALDDFGTGHSSLEYLRELKVSRLKVDRAFIKDIETDPFQARFLGSILSLANEMKFPPVIEGVETAEQWLIVEQLGAKIVQGYYAHRPMRVEAFRQLLEEKQAKGASQNYPPHTPLSRV